MKQNKDSFVFSAPNKLSAVGLLNARQIQLKGFSVHICGFVKGSFLKESCIIWTAGSFLRLDAEFKIPALVQ